MTNENFSNSINGKVLKEISKIATSGSFAQLPKTNIELQVSNLLKKTRAFKTAKVIVTEHSKIEIRCNGQVFTFSTQSKQA